MKQPSARLLKRNVAKRPSLTTRITRALASPLRTIPPPLPAAAAAAAAAPPPHREVRGIQVVELNQRFADIRTSGMRTDVKERVAEWYLDRLGKLERFRRHAYTVALTPYSVR